jgi:hypothetical protein
MANQIVPLPGSAQFQQWATTFAREHQFDVHQVREHFEVRARRAVLRMQRLAAHFVACELLLVGGGLGSPSGSPFIMPASEPPRIPGFL